MHLQGTAFIRSETEKPHYAAKLVVNMQGAIFFSVSAQHKDQSGPGIYYKEGYKGNALAAMLAPGTIEIRYHRDFTDDQVARIMSALLSHRDLECLSPSRVTYQGRAIALTPPSPASHPPP